jgi:hypothetical protein
MSGLDDSPAVRVHHAVLFPREWATGLKIVAPGLEGNQRRPMHDSK